MPYQRVTEVVRYQIETFLELNISIPSISKRLGFNKSSIYREIQRNSGNRGYDASTADKLSKSRFKACRKAFKIQGELEESVLTALSLKWSPEQISGRYRREDFKFQVSHQCIYAFILRQDLRSSLRRFNWRGFARKARRNIRLDWAKPIATRPKIINRRGRFGDWERDSAYTKNRKLLLVCTERKSRLTKIERIKTLTTKAVAKQTTKLLESAGRKVFSVTNDNGQENKHQLKYPVYFCDPQRPSQRGTVENTIGLIRQFITRKTDLDLLTNNDIQEVEDLLNYRPRKSLDFKTPYEVFYKQTVALAI